MVGVNPWTSLPPQAPYVLEQDKVPIVRFNATAAEQVRIHTELLPEPFFGSLDAAVVLLGLNPGFKESDRAVHSRPDFIEASRRNLNHQALEYPFLYLDPRFIETPGGHWWVTNLQPLLDEGIELEVLSHHIMCVEWFPYHSPCFQALPTLIPSQHYAFGLVARAIGRDALIIIMRAKGRWLESVPGLASYRRRRALKSN